MEVSYRGTPSYIIHIIIFDHRWSFPIGLLLVIIQLDWSKNHPAPAAPAPRRWTWAATGRANVAGGFWGEGSLERWNGAPVGCRQQTPKCQHVAWGPEQLSQHKYRNQHVEAKHIKSLEISMCLLRSQVYLHVPWLKSSVLLMQYICAEASKSQS